MTALPLIDVIGAWIGIFLTFCVLSFLYKDNPFYKLAEHLFIGISIGYLVIQQYTDNIQPKLVSQLADGHWWKLIALLLVLMMFVKAVSRRYSWLGRYPLCFVVALFSGMQINAVAQAELGSQLKFAAQDLDSQKVDINKAGPEELATLPGMTPLVVAKLVAERDATPFTSIDDALSRPTLTAADRVPLADARGPLVGIDAKAGVGGGQRNWFGVISNVLLLFGVLASLLYFYFSIAHKGVIGKVSRVGVWILMIGFGASFGLTVQGRIALAIGRGYDVLGRTVNPQDAAQIHAPIASLVSMAIVIAGIAAWELRERRRGKGPNSGPDGGSAGGGGAPAVAE